MVDWEVEIDRLRMVKRDKWGAMMPRRRDYLKSPVYNVILAYNTGTPRCHTRRQCCHVVRELQRYEMKKVGMPDLKYSFMIGGDGRVYEGRGWRVSAVAPDKLFPLDRRSIIFGFLGVTRKRGPEFVQWTSIYKLLALGIDSELISKHFDISTSRQ